MTCVLKIGGAALESPETLARCVQAIQDLHRIYPRLLVIHGGGLALTRTLKRLGKESTFINGLRVTDVETRDAALMVLCGFMNKTLVSAVTCAGVDAIGMSGGDGATILARKTGGATDLGFVGDVVSIRTQWLETIWNAGGVPIMASMAPDTDGQYFNINADKMATACAAACQAQELIFLTDVQGVLDGHGKRIAQLTSKTIDSLIHSAVITGGMLPKMSACQAALTAGVGKVHIFPANQAHLLTSADDTMTCGTEVTLQ